jgi:hypothetical protein
VQEPEKRYLPGSCYEFRTRAENPQRGSGAYFGSPDAADPRFCAPDKALRVFGFRNNTPAPKFLHKSLVTSGPPFDMIPPLS